MNKCIAQILFILILTISISAQTEEREPILIDEFGIVNSEQMAASLDGYMVSLMNNPNARGVIRISGDDEECFLCRYRRSSWIGAYVKNTRKFPSERYMIEYCDENKVNFRTQLYLLPKAESKLPKCEETLSIPKKSILFDGIYFYFEDDKITPLEDSFIDVVGPAHGEYSRNVLKKVKILLEKSPESKIYIIVYLGTNFQTGYYDEKKEKYIEKEIRNLDKKSLAKILLKNVKKEFIKNGIKLSQIETIEGGYVEGKRELEFWFVPKGEEIPKPKPNYFPKKTKI